MRREINPPFAQSDQLLPFLLDQGPKIDYQPRGFNFLLQIKKTQAL
ncbi:hypothetical protein T4E_1640 [Trichinella pseudospiralis]|uniref:Uncharacterized protein n=1 Tax=Trichinella pseudospiralis TaxID=6337 RepID=A0A0V0X6J6_TRIPS|nr:hypothetical protein T4E_1640 [Trichinella pseudospiralis]